MENFEQFLKSKKIDSKSFQNNEDELWRNWNELYEQVHPESFIAQQLYLINNIRRKYPLKAEQKNIEIPKKRVRPVIKR